MGDRGVKIPISPESHKTIEFLSNTDADLRNNHKVTNPAFNVGLSWARTQNNI